MNIETKDPLGLKRGAFHTSQTMFISFVAWCIGVKVLIGAIVTVLVVELLRFSWPWFQNFLVEQVGDYMDERERSSPPTKIFSIAPMLFGLIVLMQSVSARMFWYVIVTISFGDPLARIFGMKYGQNWKLWWAKKKSMPGFLAMWGVGLLAAVPFGLTVAQGFVISLSIALAESFGSRDEWHRDDNLLNPLAGAAATRLCILLAI